MRKLLFNGGGRALPCTRQEPFAKGSWISKNLKKHYPINTFLKVLGILKGLFQKSLKRVQGRALADKPKFETLQDICFRISEHLLSYFRKSLDFPPEP
jgi:hypothetical protein